MIKFYLTICVLTVALSLVALFRVKNDLCDELILYKDKIKIANADKLLAVIKLMIVCCLPILHILTMVSFLYIIFCNKKKLLQLLRA